MINASSFKTFNNPNTLAFKLANKDIISIDQTQKSKFEMLAKEIIYKMYKNNISSITLVDNKDFLCPKYIFMRVDKDFILGLDYPGYESYHVKFDDKVRFLGINSNRKSVNCDKAIILKALEEINQAIELGSLATNKELIIY